MTSITPLFVAILLANLISALAIAHAISWWTKSEIRQLSAKLEDKGLALFKDYRKFVEELQTSAKAPDDSEDIPCDEEEENAYSALDVEWHLQQRKFDNKEAFVGLPDFRPIVGTSLYWMDAHGYIFKMIEEGEHVSTVELRMAEAADPELCVMTSDRLKTFRNIPVLYLHNAEGEYSKLVREAGFAA